MSNQIRLFFAYLFFSLFVFVSLSLLVSQFSSTFSQLFLILSGKGRIFDIVLHLLLLLGVGMCLFSLILSSWNQKENLKLKILVLCFCLLFVFLFVFSLFSPKDEFTLIDLIVPKKQDLVFWEIFLGHFSDFLVFGFFYFFFIFAPLAFDLFNFSPNPHHPWGKILLHFKPSINIVIYALTGSALQSFFHKSYWFFYLDLCAFIVGFIALCLFYRKSKKNLDFYELCNFYFLCFAILIFAFCSKFIEEKVFIARYDFLLLAFVAWCGEWMINFCETSQDH